MNDFVLRGFSQWCKEEPLSALALLIQIIIVNAILLGFGVKIWTIVF